MTTLPARHDIRQTAEEFAWNDPVDGWQRPAGRGYIWPADRAEPVCMEGFTPQNATPVLAQFLRRIRTDFHHWSHDLEWTLESGPEDAPSSIEIIVPYNYSGGSSDFFNRYLGAWEPGDSAEAEIGVAQYLSEDGQWNEIVLLQGEEDRILQHIHENPPEPPDYGDDW